jgi:predicted alpha/beta superfamily hydrolase
MTMGKWIPSLVLICFIHPGLNAQEQVSVGTNRMIMSTALKGEVTYIEHLPDGYDKTNRDYPVVYVLNAQSTTAFANAAATADYLSSERIPDVILIGISNTGVAAKCWACPDDSGHLDASAAFSSFMEKELIPEITKKYRTNNYRVLMGQSNSGLFVLYSLFFHPGLFDAYIVASPMFGWCPDFYLNETEKFLQANKGINKRLFVSYGELDYVEVLGRINDFDHLLHQQAPAGLKWELELIKNEGHVPYASLHNALLFFFSECTMTAERKKGSIDEVKAHFEELSKDYGFTVAPKGDVLFDMAFDLKNQEKFAAAVVWLKYLVSLYPQSAIYYYGLGLTLYEKGDVKEARECFVKSLEIDPELPQPKAMLKKLDG